MTEVNSFNNPSDPGVSGSAPQGSSFTENNSDPQGGTGSGQGGSNSNIDVSKLQKRIDDSQRFIEQLKSESSQYRETIKQLTERMEKVPSLDAIMEQINQNGRSNDNLDPEDLVNKTLSTFEARQQERERAAKADDNFKQVASTLQKHFSGKDVDAEVRRLAQENDMSFEDVFDMAKRNPKAVYKVLGINVNSAPQGYDHSSGGTLNTYGVTSNQPPQEDKVPNLVKVRTEKERINLFSNYMEKELRKLNNY